MEWDYEMKDAFTGSRQEWIEWEYILQNVKKGAYVYDHLIGHVPGSPENERLRKRQKASAKDESDVQNIQY